MALGKTLMTQPLSFQQGTNQLHGDVIMAGLVKVKPDFLTQSCHCPQDSNLCSKAEQECCTGRTSVPGAGPAQSYPRGHRRSRGQSDSSSEGAGESRQMHARAVLHIIELSSHHQRNWGSLKWPTVHVPRTPHSILKWRALKTVKYWIWKGLRVWAHTVQNNLILWALFNYFFYVSTSFWK